VTVQDDPPRGTGERRQAPSAAPDDAARDQTTIPSTEQEVRGGRKGIHVADEAKHQFLATLSHEVRTPLNVILGVVDLLQESVLDDQQAEHVGTIAQSADNLLYLINDFIDLTRIDSGLMIIENVTFELAALVEEVLGTYRRQTDHKGLSLEVSMTGDQSLHLIGDRHRIGQILSNLLANAVKFTPEGTVKLNIEVRQSQEGQGSRVVVFRVSDSGIGIRPEFQHRLFERFFQADASSTRRFDGTGLGLNICATLADLMGGRVWLEKSQPGRGSTFVFEIRLATAEEPPEGSGPADQEPRGFEPRLQPPVASTAARSARILLAEDNPVNRTVLVQLLENAGHTADEAENGEVAVRCASASRYDLIFLDLSMPVLDGFEAARKIRQLETDRVPIVALTAHVGEAFRQRCLAVGMDDFLPKPVNRDELLATVAKWCDPQYSVVVFADDQEASHQYVSILEGGRYRAIPASTPAEAVQLVRAHQVTSVIVDVAFDLSSGLSTVQALREHDSGVSIVFMSDDWRPDVERSALAAGCTVVLAKPVLRRKLLTAVRSMFSEAAADDTAPQKAEPREKDKIEIVVDPDIEDLVADYLAMLRRQVHELRDLAASGEIKKIRTLSHDLKGSAGAYGFQELGEIGAKLEEAAKAEDTDTVERLRKDLASYLSRVVIGGR
jgi:signal transduction histidine kinase/CheY-like chemotaxis protein/HPt (histidine-containing phosphotransfer) domain-containing protein